MNADRTTKPRDKRSTLRGKDQSTTGFRRGAKRASAAGAKVDADADAATVAAAVERQASIVRAFSGLPDDAGVEVRVVAALKSVSVPTVWRWARDGTLPQPERAGRITRWRVGDLRGHRLAG